MDTQDFAIDLGTSNTVIYLKRHGIVLDEPSAVAIDLRTGQSLGAGRSARRRVAEQGRAPTPVTLVRPLQAGLIDDAAACEAMLRSFVDRVSTSRWTHRHRTVICVPSRLTEAERQVVREVARLAGACYAVVLSKPMAAAVGAGVPVGELAASLIVDIGGGTTDVALLSYGSVVASRTVEIAGGSLDAAVGAFLNRTFDLVLEPSATEAVKIKIGSAYPLAVELNAEIRGSDLKTGLRRSVVVSTEQIRHALDPVVTSIVEVVTATLASGPVGVVKRLRAQGITLVGGGAQLHGLAERLQADTGLGVRVARKPRYCAATGSGRYLDAYGARMVDHLGGLAPAATLPPPATIRLHRVGSRA